MLSSARVPRFAFCSVLSLAAIGGCEGSHDDLGQTTSTSSTGGSTTGTGGAGGGNGGAGGAPIVVEPDGPTKLTLVNAIADRDALRLCFLKSPADAGDVAQPYPAAPLGFGHATAFALPGAPVPASGDVEVLALSGDLSGLGGAACRAIADDPGAFAGVDAISLGVLPASTFLAKRSLLLAVGGCFGGVGNDDPNAEEVCGLGYTSDTPTPTVTIAPLSRLPSTGIGFQAVHAGLGEGNLATYVQPGTTEGTPVVLSTSVAPGQAAPFPPNDTLTKSTFGAPSSASFLTAPESGATMQLETPLAGPLSRGNASDADFADGKNLAFVIVGAGPEAPSGFWHPLDVVVVKADP